MQNNKPHIRTHVILLKELNDEGLKANEWVGHIQAVMNGKGGGKEMSAQATGTNVSCLNQVLNMATQFVEGKLGMSSAQGAALSGSGDSNTRLVKLNTHLADHSYIKGFAPSQSDVAVFNALGKQPASQYVHLAR